MAVPKVSGRYEIQLAKDQYPSSMVDDRGKAGSPRISSFALENYVWTNHTFIKSQKDLGWKGPLRSSSLSPMQ